MEVGHAHISTLHLMVFQGHTNGHIKVEVEEGGSKQTVNSSNICSYALTAAVESSCKAWMTANSVGGELYDRVLEYGPQGVVVH